MKHLKASFLGLIAVCAISLTAWSAPIELNPEVERLEKSLEQKVYAAVKTYFGEDSRFVASVHVKESEVRPAKKDKAPAPEVGVDILYAPIPLVNDFVQNTPTPEEARKHLVIDSVEVEIQVAGDVDTKALTNAKDLVRKTLKAFNPTVTVSKLTVPQRSLAAVPSPSPTPAKAEADAGKLDFRSLMPMIAVITAAVILALGIIFIAQALRSSAQTLVSGLSHVFLSGKNSDKLGVEGASEEKPIVLEHRNAPDKKPKKTTSPEAHLRDYGRNIGIIKESLAQDPMLFLRALIEGDHDLCGCKWLLPNLTSDEQDLLRRYLGVKRVARIAEIDSDSIDFEPTSWLQDFVERLMLKRIQDRTIVEKAVGPDRTVKLYLMPSKQLAEAARQLNTPASWRILSEFASKEELEKVLAELPTEQWQTIVQGAALDSESISITADQILSRLSEASDAVSDERSSFYSKTLLDPVLRSLSEKEFGKEEEFLDQVGSQAPELIAMVHERFWTPRDLDRVPESVLTQLMKKIRNEQRVALLYALPEAYSQRLQELLPQGNVRTIVMDQLARAKQRNNPNELRDAVLASREILENLRQQHMAGVFKLTDEVTSASNEVKAA